MIGSGTQVNMIQNLPWQAWRRAASVLLRRCRSALVDIMCTTAIIQSCLRLFLPSFQLLFFSLFFFCVAIFSSEINTYYYFMFSGIFFCIFFLLIFFPCDDIFLFYFLPKSFFLHRFRRDYHNRVHYHTSAVLITK